MGYFLPPLRGEIKAQVVSGHQLRAPKHPALRGEIKAQVVSGWNSLPAEMLDAAVAPHTEDGFSVTGAVIVARVSSCARAHPGGGRAGDIAQSLLLVHSTHTASLTPPRPPAIACSTPPVQPLQQLPGCSPR